MAPMLKFFAAFQGRKGFPKVDPPQRFGFEHFTFSYVKSRSKPVSYKYSVSENPDNRKQFHVLMITVLKILLSKEDKHPASCIMIRLL